MLGLGENSCLYNKLKHWNKLTKNYMSLSILKRGCTRLHNPPVSTKTCALPALLQAHFLTFYVASAWLLTSPPLINLIASSGLSYRLHQKRAKSGLWREGRRNDLTAYCREIRSHYIQCNFRFISAVYVSLYLNPQSADIKSSGL